MQITFRGACQEVTGSLFHVQVANKNILVDCGLMQGVAIAEERNLEEFSFDPASIDAVLITHAHLDHCGRIPKLVRDGFNGQIISTAPTLRLVELILDDSVHIMEEEARRHGHDQLYTEEDVTNTKALFVDAQYRTPVQLDEVTVEFFDAGHILGSSMIRITGEGKSVVFTGDMGNPPVPILEPTDIIGDSDYVVMESTYGGRTHEDKDTRTELLRTAITETLAKKGVLMIPAFAMERTQEILFELNTLHENGEIPENTAVFLDSPLAIKATHIFKEYESYFNTKTQDIIKSGDDVFHFPGLQMTLSPRESKRINSHPSPKVIIAGSGMAQGGRIQHHIERYIDDPNSMYLIVGYQANGSLGRKIYDGAKTITVHNKELEVKAQVKAIGGYSAHADQPKLTEWIQTFDQTKLKKVFLVHGEEDQASALQEHLGGIIDAEVVLPERGSTVDL